MGRLEEDKSYQEDIKNRLLEISRTDIEKLSKLHELGTELSFGDCAPYFAKIIELYGEVHGFIESEQMPHVFLDTINNNLNNTQSLYNRFTQFSLTTPQPQGRNIPAERTSMIAEGMNHFDYVFNALYPIISYYSAKNSNVGRMKSETELVLIDMKKELLKIQSIKDEANSALATVQNVAQEAGVSQHAEIFYEEAKSHETDANHWLIATGGVTAITVCICAYFFYQSVYSSKVLSGEQTIQAAVAKVALLSVLFTATVWVGRIYRSHRHNAIVNRHRSNALRTFEAFAKATSDDSTKNAVLIKATECIFAPQQTGYTSHEPETGGAAQVVEIVRGMASGSK
jgi:hypothetical protein